MSRKFRSADYCQLQLMKTSLWKNRGNCLKVAQNKGITARINYFLLLKKKGVGGEYSSPAKYPDTLTTVNS